MAGRDIGQSKKGGHSLRRGEPTPLISWSLVPREGEEMADLETKNLDAPEETRSFDKGMAELVSVGGATIGRFTFNPGWKWSESVKPIVGTDRCQNHHQGVSLTGHMHVVGEDGTEIEIGPGEAYNIPPGHDAWVVGGEPFVGFEFKSAAQYAKPS